jgi:hypothetical protein
MPDRCQHLIDHAAGEGGPTVQLGPGDRGPDHGVGTVVASAFGPRTGRL